MEIKQKIIRFVAAGGIATVYAISPIDIIPDFIPGIGQVDDSAVILAAVVFIIRTIFKK
ncbi:MAG: DUF1232 domain-containing protein [Ignavibacteria bacterium]|jgi:uncharacterized membrane protein YkvA (DUF1232 family)|nr:DUF1232 domain-containing protein [Ignavibacteria bacterium]